MIHVDFICIVRPDKDITIENVEEFQALLTSLSTRAGVHMVVDLSGVGMITTPGISALLETSRLIRDGGGAIAAARGADQCRGSSPSSAHWRMSCIVAGYGRSSQLHRGGVRGADTIGSHGDPSHP